MTIQGTSSTGYNTIAYKSWVKSEAIRQVKIFYPNITIEPQITMQSEDPDGKYYVTVMFQCGALTGRVNFTISKNPDVKEE